MPSTMQSIRAKVIAGDEALASILDMRKLAQTLCGRRDAVTDLEMFFIQSVAEHGLVGANLMIFMRRAGFTQSSLADKMGVKRAQVSAWINGVRNPAENTLLSLARILGCTVDDLRT